MKHLSNTSLYEEMQSDLFVDIIHGIYLYPHNMWGRGHISDQGANYWTTDIEGTEQFYLLPKISLGR